MLGAEARTRYKGEKLGIVLDLLILRCLKDIQVEISASVDTVHLSQGPDE